MSEELAGPDAGMTCYYTLIKIKLFNAVSKGNDFSF